MDETRNEKMNNGGDWQGMTFIFPENVEAEKQKYHYRMSAAIQPVQPVQPAWQAQPTQNPAATSTTRIAVLPNGNDLWS